MYFTLEKFKKYLEQIEKSIYEKSYHLEELEFSITDKNFDEIDNTEWDKFYIGNRWGKKDETYWFKKKVIVPKEWNKNNISLYFDLGAGDPFGLSGTESLIYINKKPVQGLDINHNEVYVKPEWIMDNEIEVYIKAFSGLNNENNLFSEAKIVQINKYAEDYYYRTKTLLETINEIENNSFDSINLINILDEAFKMIDFRKPTIENFYNNIREANIYLKGKLYEYKSKGEKKPKVIAIGHSHIDVAWLWRLKHTREKCARTFSTVNHLMDQYDNYQFLQSQPQLYDYIKSDYPEIYNKIKNRIEENKWEITGGMWVEADCNIPSGESLVRQILFGQRFIKKEFGRESKILWLPDVFGYSWALPQIIKKSGLKYFMTTKISWSQYNKPEYDTFKWRGIDGTEVLTHFITTPTISEESASGFYTYNGMLTPKSVKGVWDNYNQKDINDELLLAYGFGDGGGGPTKEMIETGEKIKEMPCIPEVEFGKAESFFDKLEEKVSGEYRLPTIDGELYLEYHRGTYSSQGKIKRNNRKSEILLHDMELFNSISYKKLNNIYYQKDINEAWKILLRNQFHDILPGSSIKEVYEDSQKEFDELFSKGYEILNSSLENIADNIDKDGLKLVVFNSLSWKRGGEAYIDYNEALNGKIIVDENNNQLFTKIIDGKLKINVEEIPPLGYKTFKVVDGNKKYFEKQVTINKNVIENKYYIIKLNDKGQISSIYDKESKRDVLPKGTNANVLQTFEDRPMNFDAWDIDIYYREKVYEVDDLAKMEILENDSDRVVVKLTYRVLNSIITQKIIVYSDKRRIDFDTNVIWNEHQVLLKALFPVDVRNTKATYEIQFGNVERNTHWNTSWDYAKFETVAHKWVDFSERNYGVSLLNDCKYGHDIKDNNIRITLIKSGIDPDPNADIGEHKFVYSLMPHKGNWFEAGIAKEAYELNYPLYAKISEKKGSLNSENSFIEIEENSTILDTIKKSEDDEGIILRFFEYSNSKDKVRVKTHQQIKKVYECDLIENNIKEINFDNNSFSFDINPYEIKTYKVFH